MKKHIPTFQELLTLYPKIAQIEAAKNDRPSTMTVRNIVMGVKGICQSMNIDLGATVDTLTRGQIDAYLTSAAARGHTRVTAWTYVRHLQALVAKWTRPYYAERNLSVQPFDLPVCHCRSSRYLRPEHELLVKVKDWYASLEVRKDRRDWLVSTLMLEFAMRNGDIERLHWGDFREKEGRTVLCYTPRKTSLTSGRVVAWPVHPEIWKRLCAVREANGLRLGTHFQGLVVPGAQRVFARLNAEIRRQHFFTGTKGCYELRKICIDHVYQKFGAEMASSISGDDIRTVTRYYADPSAVTVTGVRIVDLI